MNYLYIRKCIRNKEVAKLVLTEKYIEEHTELRRMVIEREMAEVDVGVYKEPDWGEIEREEPVLWYPPFEFSQ